MSATASLPAPLHIKRGHVVGLSVVAAAVAIAAVSTSWALRTNTSSSSSPLPAHRTEQEIVSTIDPGLGYVAGVVAMTPAERAAAFGQISPAQDYVAGVVAMTPAERAAAFGNSSVGGLSLTPSEQQFVQAITSLPAGASPGFGTP